MDIEIFCYYNIINWIKEIVMCNWIFKVDDYGESGKFERFYVCFMNVYLFYFIIYFVKLYNVYIRLYLLIFRLLSKWCRKFFIF